MSMFVFNITNSASLVGLGRKVLFSRLSLTATQVSYQGLKLQARNMGSSDSKSYSPNQQCSSVRHSEHGTISRTDSRVEYVEAVVCNADDLKENEMKVFDIGEHGKVLLVKQKGEFSAVGTKCTHYGAPLNTGALGDGRVRCPWHGACFNLKSGDIEDFPGFDSLPCHQVTITEKGEVKVRANKEDLKTNKRVKDVGRSSPCEDTAVVIIGGGPSGATCTETLRSEGFGGRITLVCKENYLPYDRVKVSKIGTATDIDKLQARTEQYYEGANIEIIKGVEATKVNTGERIVELSNGTKRKYSALYIATGAKARVPDIPGIDLENILTVRNFDDSIKILTKLGSDKAKNVVVLGLSFIGLEIASSCVQKSKSMTVIGKDTLPLGQVFGTEIGQSLRTLFEDKNVQFHFETTIAKCNGENGVIKSVELTNGTTLPADLLVLGIGTTFYTDFLKDSGIHMLPNGAVNVNDKLETNIKNVYAGGDIAYAPVFIANNQQMNIGHIGLAQYHGQVAAKNIIKKETPLRSVPYFWTMLFGKSIRFAGCGKPVSSMVDGDVAGLKFVIFFFDENDKVISVGSCMRDPVVSQFAEFLYQGKSIYRKDLENNTFGWTETIH
ncbi:apoptosis-inducing factor 3 isoform X2 [Leptidea sinapis]|uniref:apoptosis-inducing factor 3 isoform X2 n=1 Tax=Leptidea sinapis TaxID=189913 RepID=UPI0021C3E1C3|nr:apoptosis-inducing factor 3 isoform X2 [Leptidea sinapis]